MNKNMQNVSRLFIRYYSLKPPGRKNWPKPMMLGPQTVKHPKFPGWPLYYFPASDSRYQWFFVILAFQLTGISLPLLGIYKMLKTMYSYSFILFDPSWIYLKMLK
ncbi:unnamed protein product [Thelazia callipaeda]|uniref:Uncharacterized protein n=1 Tax=Thelazia callipaeda TaxID=103827 RepID=A0A0N5CRT2_THECL|nr:unnamed protein product [Thelazia callipaeda]